MVPIRELLPGDSPRINDEDAIQVRNLVETGERQALIGGRRVIEGLGRDFGELDAVSAVTLSVSALKLDRSIRVDGTQEEYVRILAETDEEFPPIVVQDPSMRVIDGNHRVRVAMMRGTSLIEAKLVRCSDSDAVVLAVRLNGAHGLPLTRSDRNAAAEKIVHGHPQWSNRMIAKVSGLSAATVAGIRKRSTGQVGHSNIRVGLDGRTRPVSGDDGRRRVAELLSRKPEASVREVAREAGVSPSTVHGVRTGQSSAAVVGVQGRVTSSPAPDSRRVRADVRVENLSATANTIETLTKDPSIRLTDVGRRMIRLLHRSSSDLVEYNLLVDQIPEHCVALIAGLNRRFANEWIRAAENLEQRQRRKPS